MATLRISSVQSSPDTEFRLFADATIDQANRRWKVLAYITAINKGTTASFYGGSGTHRGYVNGALFRTHSGTPFLPSGVGTNGTRWNEGPYTVYVDAPTDGTLTIPLRMTMNYGSIDYDKTVNLVLPDMGWAAPGVPSGLSGTSNAPGAIDVDWNIPSGHITGYRISYRVKDTATWSYTTDSAPKRYLTGLTPGAMYELRIQAYNEDSSSAYSGSVFVRADAMPPSAPGAPTVTGTTVDTASLSWVAPPNGGSAITGYDVQWNTSQTDAGATTESQAATTTKTITGLDAASTYYARVRAKNVDYTGDWSPWSAISTAGPPLAPAMPTVSDVTTTTATVTWAAPGTGGSAITGYDVQYNTSQSDTGATIDSGGTGLSRGLTALQPGTGYFTRVRGVNAAGPGAWSPWRSFTTVPAVAPGMTVAPSPNGRSAVITLSPPGGVTGVTKYVVERRIGTGAATSTDVLTSPYTATGLTPGTTYQWRASAFIGTYQSPWTNWASAAQPRPNTSPGDFYSGATAATDDTTYAWTGTAQKSTSTATGFTPKGWVTFTQGAAASGGTGVVSRVSDAIATYPDGSTAGQYAARVTFFTDTTAPGFALGPAAEAGAVSAVSEGGVYTGSIFARPSVDQDLAARIVWLNAALATISVDVGAFATVAAGDVARPSVVAQAPIGAVFAVAQAVDANGWSAGDSLTADGSMISLENTAYFDGAAPQSPLFDYAWLDVAHDSPSIRTNRVQVAQDPLADPDCPPVPDPPVAQTITSDCIEDVGVWRRYYSVIPEQEVGQWTTTLPTLVMQTGGSAERQIRIRVYANPDNLPPEQVDTSTWEAETIISYLPASSTLTLDSVAQRAWAVVPGSSDSIPADRLLYGTGGIPATWPTLTCGTAYLLSFDTPLDSPSGNLSTEVYLTDRVL